MASLKLGLFTTLLSMGGIFLVLIILALVTMLIARLIDRKTQPHEKRTHQENSEKTASLPQTSAFAAPAVEGGINPKTVAAIMAAVSAASGGSTLKFTSIHRIGSISTPWTSASNVDIISNRQQYL